MKTKQVLRSAMDFVKVADNCGSHYFSEGAMEGFGTRLLEGFWATNEDSTEGVVTLSNFNPHEGKRGKREYRVAAMVYLEPEASGHLQVDVSTLEPIFTNARAAKLYAAEYAASERQA